MRKAALKMGFVARTPICHGEGMKFLASPITAFCLSISALVAVAHAEVSPVHMRIEASNKAETTKTSSTQSRSLTVYVDNSSQEQMELKVKYEIFGRDATSKDIVSVGKGEVPVSVKPHGQEKVSTPEAKATYNDPKPAKGQTKKVDPSGEKIVGHGIQLLKGDTVLAEIYEPMSMKDSFGKATAAAPAAAAPKKP
jgi:hypothetical protein